MKNELWVFTKTNCRRITHPNPKELKAYESHSALNPNLDQVRGIPPHFWKLENHLVIPMNEQEQKMRLMEIKKSGFDNEVKRLKEHWINPSFPFFLIRQLTDILFFVLVCLALYEFIKHFYA